jgi:hypothetical protein
MSQTAIVLSAAVCWLLAMTGRLTAQEPTVDLSAWHAASGVDVRQENDTIVVSWPSPHHDCAFELDLRPGQPLFRTIGLRSHPGAENRTLIKEADPVTFLLVGTREAPGGRPPGMSVFNTFFDAPANRPFQTYQSRLDKKRIRIASQAKRATISIAEVTIGPFTGELRLTVYCGASLIHVETVVHTNEERRAILYDGGLALSSGSKPRFAWIDTEGKLQRREPSSDAPDQPLAVRHRVLIAETAAGSVACFPPPHQFFFPRDQTVNLKTVWFGRDHRGLESRFAFGVRQPERGGGSYVPWYNAPPGTDQRLSAFYLLTDGDAEHALAETLRFTHGDRFPRLAGHHTFTSHWHMATAMAAVAEQANGKARTIPDLVPMFQQMGVEIVHLAEFHGDGHPHDPGPIRLPELQAMFDECQRLSDGKILFLPGEEANAAIGKAREGKEAGHWLYLFPRPVYWTMKRTPAQPFMEPDPNYGTVFHVGSGDDMARLLEHEGGLAWTSHARIKGSSWTPDFFRNQAFYQSRHWLGAAWKAMPADLSLDKLGVRGLDLLDDMANRGDKKFLPGEVDVFKIDRTHELFGHMNINYLRLQPDRLPRFDESWQPIIDSLSSGHFFVSTGEILIPEFTVNGQPSGSTVMLSANQTVEVHARISGTFPLRYAELISGDGKRVYRDRIDLSDTGPFGERELRHKVDATGRTWLRLEVWDVATDGAFTQPVWLSNSTR